MSDPDHGHEPVHEGRTVRQKVRRGLLRLGASILAGVILTHPYQTADVISDGAGAVGIALDKSGDVVKDTRDGIDEGSRYIGRGVLKGANVDIHNFNCDTKPEGGFPLTPFPAGSVAAFGQNVETHRGEGGEAISGAAVKITRLLDGSLEIDRSKLPDFNVTFGSQVKPFESQGVNYELTFDTPSNSANISYNC